MRKIDERRLDQVLQLTDISRPIVAEQKVDRLRAQGLNIASEFVVELGDEMLGKREEFVFALAQRR